MYCSFIVCCCFPCVAVGVLVFVLWFGLVGHSGLAIILLIKGNSCLTLDVLLLWRVYCKFRIFCEIFIFANSVKRHICDLKIANMV